MKKFFSEFKKFVFKGNALDLAIAVIIGAAFQGIIKSFVRDIASPLLGLFMKQNFDSLSISFWGITLPYGSFIAELINFTIMAFIIFILVKAINKLKEIGLKSENSEQEPPITKPCPFCISEIDIAATRCPHCTSEISE